MTRLDTLHANIPTRINRLTNNWSARKSTDESQRRGQEVLATQRLNRPVSPHLSIYRPQITWLGSITHRITGVILSSVFYLFGVSYVFAPYLGWNLDSIVAVLATWPVAAKVATKITLAFPFAFHCFNGIRHLLWDSAIMMTNRQVVVGGWATVVLSGLTALYFATL